MKNMTMEVKKIGTQQTQTSQWWWYQEFPEEDFLMGKTQTFSPDIGEEDEE